MCVCVCVWHPAVVVRRESWTQTSCLSVALFAITADLVLLVAVFVMPPHALYVAARACAGVAITSSLHAHQACDLVHMTLSCGVATTRCATFDRLAMAASHTSSEFRPSVYHSALRTAVHKNPALCVKVFTDIHDLLSSRRDRLPGPTTIEEGVVGAGPSGDNQLQSVVPHIITYVVGASPWLSRGDTLATLLCACLLLSLTGCFSVFSFFFLSSFSLLSWSWYALPVSFRAHVQPPATLVQQANAAFWSPQCRLRAAGSRSL
mgnify:CR=1 FL=1